MENMNKKIEDLRKDLRNDLRYNLRDMFAQMALNQNIGQDHRKRSLVTKVMNPELNIKGGIILIIMKTIMHHTQEIIIGLDMNLSFENQGYTFLPFTLEIM